MFMNFEKFSCLIFEPKICSNPQVQKYSRGQNVLIPPNCILLLIQQKSSSLPRNLALGTFGKCVLNKGKSAIPPLFNGPEVLPSASDKAKLFAKTFLRTLTLMSQAFLSVFPSRINPKLHKIS